MQTDMSPNYAAVYGVNLSEWDEMLGLDSAQQGAEKALAGATGDLLKQQAKVGAEDKQCRAECKKKYNEPITDYQLAACLSGCQLGLSGTSTARATFTPPTGTVSSIGTCNALTQKGPQYCKGWADTGCCSHLAPVNASSALSQSVAGNCNTNIPSTASGHCICADGGVTAVVDCGHPEFNCNQACAPEAKRGYTYDQTPQDCTLSSDYPYLIACGQKGYCYDGVKDETYTTYYEDGEACPANRAVGDTTYYLRQSGRAPYCSPASQYTVPFCPDPRYGEFIKQGCKQPNTVTSCLATVNTGWRPDKTLCSKNHGPTISGGDGTAVLQPCFIDNIVSWGKGMCSVATCGPKNVHPCKLMETCLTQKGEWTGHVHCSFNNVPGLNIFPQDVKKIKRSPALYFYTAPPPGGDKFFADPITSMSTGSDGVLYIYTHMNPGTASGGGPIASGAGQRGAGATAGPIRIPAKYASCFTNATTIYVAPTPGTAPEPFTNIQEGLTGASPGPNLESAAAGGMDCPSRFPHLLEYAPQGRYYCYEQSDGNTTGRGGLCNCDCPDCGKNSNFSPCTAYKARCKGKPSAPAPAPTPNAPGCSPPPTGNSFEVHHGSYIAQGENVIPMMQNITVEKAKSICQQTPGCAGFTFLTEKPSGGIWFKTSSTLTSSGSTAPQWTSYLLTGGHTSNAPLGKPDAGITTAGLLPPGMVMVPTGPQLSATCSNAANCSGGGTGAHIRKNLSKATAKQKKLEAAALADAVESQANWHAVLSELNTIRGALPGTQQQLAEKMALYRDLYQQIGEDQTMNTQLSAMLQDGHYSVNKATSGYYIWFILAISIMLAALRQLNR